MRVRSVDGYRIAAQGVGDLAGFFAGFRADALRVLVRRYGATVAEEAVRAIDLHRAGVSPREPKDNPLREAVDRVRTAFAAGDRRLDFDCRLALHLLEDAVLLSWEEGADDYRNLLECRPDVTPCPWSEGEPPEGVAAEEWSERERLWALAFPTPRLGSALAFRLVDGQLPLPRWDTVRRRAPAFATRVANTAKARLHQGLHGTPRPTDRDAAAAFRRWLATEKGGEALREASSAVSSLLTREFERQDLVEFGALPKPRQIQRRDAAPPRPARVPFKAPPDMPQPIDHADILEGSDGRIFVAVLETGFTEQDRVFLQVAERQISFVQGGRQFGHVDDAPAAAVDLLKAGGEAIVVEIRIGEDRREIKSRHVALVRDVSIGKDYGGTMDRWRATLVGGNRRREEKLWLE